MVARAQPTAGKLLVATPGLSDPNFKRTVVYMIEHSIHGALGVVLNRPTTTFVDEMIEQWAPQASDPGLFHNGGPVSPDGVIALGRRADDATDPLDPDGDEDRFEPKGFNLFRDGVGTVDLNVDPSTITGGLRQLRLFAGHAGWGPGQLDDELRTGGWYVVPSETDDIFDPAPKDLWYRVCGRQRGSLAWLRHYPDDPKHN